LVGIALHSLLNGKLLYSAVVTIVTVVLMFGLLFLWLWANFSHNSNRNQLCNDIEQGICGKMWYSPRVTRHRPLPRRRVPGEFGMMMPFFRGRMGKLTLLLLALLVWLQYSLWFGKNGLHDYSRVNDDVAAQQATNAKLKARNDQLFAEIDDLNGGQEAIEERARNELSMTKPGETFYRLVPDASKRNQGSAQNNR
jgi:cell division protein FtsB